MENRAYSNGSAKEDPRLSFSFSGLKRPIGENESSSEGSSVDEHGDGVWENGRFIRNTGLNWFVTGLFVVGDLAGGGLVALPTALIQSGFYPGLVITVLMTFIVTYTAYLLGQCWVILLRRWPEYRKHCRKPYAEMGFRALGPRVKTIVSICIDVTQFGIATVFLLLASKNIHDFLKAFFSANISFCVVILFVAIGLLPLTFLKSPNDFWWAVVLAMCTTSLAVIFICLGSILDYDTCEKYHKMPEFNIIDYFLALGTMLFAYGGHSAFPTIQHDMKRPDEFSKSAIMAFTIVACMYVPASILGYITYGDSLRDSIINSLQIKWIQQSVNIFITLHVILTLTIVFNPLNQEAEEVLNVPHSFGPRRVAVRLGVMVAVVFVAESLPSFGPLLDLVGGSTMTLTSVVFPALFYLYLSTGEKKAEREKSSSSDADSPPTLNDVLRYTPKITLVCCALVMLFGLICGGAATFSAIRELSSTQFVAPCYVSAFQHNSGDTDTGHTNCCGPYQNISRSSSITCTKPDLKFYS
jgi:vesicular inhibitory amino acid transporter